jgi:hypothetical protein
MSHGGRFEGDFLFRCLLLPYCPLFFLFGFLLISRCQYSFPFSDEGVHTPLWFLRMKTEIFALYFPEGKAYDFFRFSGYHKQWAPG